MFEKEAEENGFEFHIANNPKYRIVCVIAWKEIISPKEMSE